MNLYHSQSKIGHKTLPPRLTTCLNLLVGSRWHCTKHIKRKITRRELYLLRSNHLVRLHLLLGHVTQGVSLTFGLKWTKVLFTMQGNIVILRPLEGENYANTYSEF